MDSIDQAKQVRLALTKMLKVYSKYEGKNLNRFKNINDIDTLFNNFRDNPPPFTFNGLFCGVIINHQKVDTTELKAKIQEVEKAIHALDLFQSSYLEEYKKIDQQIKSLVEKRSCIERKVDGLPSYMLKDLIKQ